MSPSVLYITSTQAVGYSPARGGSLTVLPADASGDIGLSIESLLAAMPGRQKQLYVLTTEVWSQAVNVESRSLRRIDKSQISQMLAFEAESFSGIPASSARTAVRLLEAGPLETSYWVSQIDTMRFVQAADAVAFNGGKLLGMMHPAGLPSTITQSATDWTRLEQWEDSRVLVTRRGRSAPQQRFLADTEELPASAAAARDYLTRSEIDPGTFVELLLQSIEPSAMPGDAEHVVDLAGEPDLKLFLSAWSKALKSPKHLPVIVPVRTRASAKTRRTVALAATAAAVIGIAGHHHWSKDRNEVRIASLQSEIEELTAPIDQFNAQQKRLGELETELSKTQIKLSDLEQQLLRYRGQLGIHRSRMALLLRALSQSRPSDMMLSSLTSDGGSIRVTGRSVRPEAITEFATTMANRLAPLNLRIRVPRREALLLTPDGGPYAFEYVISDGA